MSQQKLKTFRMIITKPGEKEREVIDSGENAADVEQFVPFMYGGGWKIKSTTEIPGEKTT